jgi:hypothetical protein
LAADFRYPRRAASAVQSNVAFGAIVAPSPRRGGSNNYYTPFQSPRFGSCGKFRLARNTRRRFP